MALPLSLAASLALRVLALMYALYRLRCSRLKPAEGLPAAAACAASGGACSGTATSRPCHPLPAHSASHTALGRGYSILPGGDGVSVLPAAQPPASSSGNSSSGGGLRAQLVRDFIHDSLYHPTEGYFSKQTALGGRGLIMVLVAPLSGCACDPPRRHPCAWPTADPLLAHCLQVRAWWAACVRR